MGAAPVLALNAPLWSSIGRSLTGEQRGSAAAPRTLAEIGGRRRLWWVSGGLWRSENNFSQAVPGARLGGSSGPGRRHLEIAAGAGDQGVSLWMIIGEDQTLRDGRSCDDRVETDRTGAWT
jgi:hypothetical protein